MADKVKAKLTRSSIGSYGDKKTGDEIEVSQYEYEELLKQGLVEDNSKKGKKAQQEQEQEPERLGGEVKEEKQTPNRTTKDLKTAEGTTKGNDIQDKDSKKK